MSLLKFANRGLAALAAGTILAATPMAIGFHPGEGFSMQPTMAFAKSGEDDDDDHGGAHEDDHGDDHGGKSGGGGGGKSGGGGSKSGGGGHGGDDRGEDDHGGRGAHGNGGYGGSSSDDKASGRGSDDDAEDDDHGRRGAQGNGKGGSSDEQASGRGSDDDEEDDDHGGGRGTDDASEARHRGGRGAATPGAVSGSQRGSGSGGLQVVKIERRANGVEVVYSNGIREEIENGQYEMKNPAGRTVMERPATQKDLSRINANARASGIAPGALRNGQGAVTAAVPSGSQAQKVEYAGRAVEVFYDTGWKEEIAAGRYELTDPNDNTVVERRATAADRSRLQALAGH